MLESRGIGADVEKTLTEEKSRHGLECEILLFNGDSERSIVKRFGASRITHAPEILTQIGRCPSEPVPVAQ